MKKIILFLFLFLIIFITFPFNLRAENSDRFALSAVSPNKTISKCINLTQDSVLSALNKNGFGPKQDASGFIFSLINYTGKPSSDFLSSEEFWSFWILENDHYQFSNLGPTSLHPQKEMSYVFYFGDGKTPPPIIKYSDVCPISSPVEINNFIPSISTTIPSFSNNQTLNEPIAKNEIKNEQIRTDDSTIKRIDNNFTNTFNYLNKNFNNQSAADQDWTAMAMGAFGKKIRVPELSDESVLSLSRHLLTLKSQGQTDPSALNKLKKSYNAGQFGETDLVNNDVFAVLALSAFDQSWLNNHQEVFEIITKSQRSDGSFGFKKDGAGDVDMTAAAVWALNLQNNRPENTLQKAMDFLNKSQNADGGFGYRPKEESNIFSSSWVKIAYTTLNLNNQNLTNYLLKTKNPNGYWSYLGEPSFRATASALLALSQKSLPIVAPFSIINVPAPETVEENEINPSLPPATTEPIASTTISNTEAINAEAIVSTSTCIASAKASADNGFATSSASAECR